MKAKTRPGPEDGRGTVFPAATGTVRPWKMKRDFLSPRPTTRWPEILVAKA